MSAAFEARVEEGRGAGDRIVVHLSAPTTGDRWAIELRRLEAKGTTPLADARAGSTLRLRGGALAVLESPFAHRGDGTGVRLWNARLSVTDVHAYARRWGRPIRYAYVPLAWPIEYYQTIFACEPGSVEMPSAGRAFTLDMVRDLERRATSRTCWVRGEPPCSWRWSAGICSRVRS
jgi:S-adenosylmethionine:tRNA ribosyltransferase-isomerase